MARDAPAVDRALRASTLELPGICHPVVTPAVPTSGQGKLYEGRLFLVSPWAAGYVRPHEPFNPRGRQAIDSRRTGSVGRVREARKLGAFFDTKGGYRRYPQEAGRFSLRPVQAGPGRESHESLSGRQSHIGERRRGRSYAPAARATGKDVLDVCRKQY